MHEVNPERPVIGPEAADSLKKRGNDLTEMFLDAPELAGMPSDEKVGIRNFINTSLGGLIDNDLKVNETTATAIAVAIAPSLEKRRIEAEYTDATTGLANSKAFAAARQRIDDDPSSSFLYVDIINLGKVNNRVGHDQGTEIIKETAAKIQDAAIRLGVAPRDVFRFGGDEFGVKVENGHARYLLRNILGSFEEREMNKVKVALRGVYGATFEEADKKMRELKEAGKPNPIYRLLGAMSLREAPLVTHLNNQ